MATYQLIKQVKQKNIGFGQSTNKLNLTQKPMLHPKCLRQAVENPDKARPETVLQLQRIYGNRALAKMIGTANSTLVPSTPAALSPVSSAKVGAKPAAKSVGKSGGIIIQRAINEDIYK